MMSKASAFRTVALLACAAATLLQGKLTPEAGRLFLALALILQGAGGLWRAAPPDRLTGWRLRVVDEPPGPGDAVLDVGAVPHAPVVRSDGVRLLQVGGPPLAVALLAELQRQHPLEDGRGRVREAIISRARALGIEARVHVVDGGKLAALLSQARSAITVNSTAAQQALWRGLPVLATGRAVFDKPGLVSHQTLDDFLRHPERPDARAYRDYRAYLLETSQVPGGFYAARSRAHALRLVVDLMLGPHDPYEALEHGRGAHRQQLENDS